jgi:predicted phosphodiesterase
MKLLVISDIHGNMKALEAAMEIPHDEVICLGDLVDYGPSPREVIDFMMENNILVIKGNHDTAVATGIDCGCSYEIKHLSIATRDYTKDQLDDSQLDFLKNLPAKIKKGIQGRQCIIYTWKSQIFL